MHTRHVALCCLVLAGWLLSAPRAAFPQSAALPVPIDPATVVFLKITPIVISVLDYTKGFGHTEPVWIDA